MADTPLQIRGGHPAPVRLVAEPPEVERGCTAGGRGGVESVVYGDYHPRPRGVGEEGPVGLSYPVSLSPWAASTTMAPENRSSVKYPPLLSGSWWVPRDWAAYVFRTLKTAASTTPSSCRPAFLWKSRTALTVRGSNRPLTAPGSNPRSSSICWSSTTSAPLKGGCLRYSNVLPGL